LGKISALEVSLLIRLQEVSLTTVLTTHLIFGDGAAFSSDFDVFFSSLLEKACADFGIAYDVYLGAA
jgi:hypothetical protein